MRWITLFAICMIVGFYFLMKWDITNSNKIRLSCTQQGMGSIGGDRSPILCYDLKTGQTFVPPIRLK